VVTENPTRPPPLMLYFATHASLVCLIAAMAPADDTLRSEVRFLLFFALISFASFPFSSSLRNS
jgi:hypothetical protein